jgi:hypothetical protein
MANHPFADVYAKHDDKAFIIGVKTRNKLTAAGTLNAAYNVCKKGTDLSDLVLRYNAQLACLALQVDIEAQIFSAFLVPMTKLNEGGERYSMPMTAKATATYECLARDEYDPSIDPDWTNQPTAENRRRQRSMAILAGTGDRQAFRHI